LINKSVQDGHIRNITQQVNIIEQMLNVFYEDLDRNIEMFASRSTIKRADTTITDYLEGLGEMMTPSNSKFDSLLILQIPGFRPWRIAPAFHDSRGKALEIRIMKLPTRNENQLSKEAPNAKKRCTP
jgi:hypothetical protein